MALIKFALLALIAVAWVSESKASAYANGLWLDKHGGFAKDLGKYIPALGHGGVRHGGLAGYDNDVSSEYESDKATSQEVSNDEQAASSSSQFILTETTKQVSISSDSFDASKSAASAQSAESAESAESSSEEQESSESKSGY